MNPAESDEAYTRELITTDLVVGSLLHGDIIVAYDKSSLIVRDYDISIKR